MESKKAMPEMSGRWVEVVEEPVWVSIRAEPVERPGDAARSQERPFSPFEVNMHLSEKRDVTFELWGLRTSITIQAPRSGAEAASRPRSVLLEPGPRPVVNGKR